MFERAAESRDGLFSEAVENLKRIYSFPSGWSGGGQSTGTPSSSPGWDRAAGRVQGKTVLPLKPLKEPEGAEIAQKDQHPIR